MINNELMKNKEYKKILIKTFNIEDGYKDKAEYPDGFWEFLKENINKYGKDCYYYSSFKMAEKTELIFTIDNIPIGIYDNKYIVAFIESDVDFDIVGDTESNWMSHAFGWGELEEPKFKELCFENFGIPIKEFNPYDVEFDDD